MFTRRDFLKWASGSAAALGLTEIGLARVERALAAESSPPLVWLHGSSCSGCSISALNAVTPTTFADVVVNRVSVRFDGLIMAAGAEQAIRAMDDEAARDAGKFILVVEGGVATAAAGRYCVIGERAGKPVTLLDAVRDLGPKAARVVAVGTCASFGGVAAAGGNPTGVQTVAAVLAGATAKPVINVPGCPAPPEQLLAVFVALLGGGEVPLDEDGRPRAGYPHTNHWLCPRKHERPADAPGEAGCFLEIGCRGRLTTAACPRHKWNNGRSWCVAAGHPCIGCAAPDFPVSPLPPRTLA